MFDSFDSHRSGGTLQTIATVVAVAISAAASFQFFAQFSGSLLSGLLPDEFLAVAAGLIGVVLCEGAALFWQRSLQHDADSQEQVQIARAGYFVSVTLSVVITMLYFLLTSDLVSPYIAEVQAVVDGFAALTLIGLVGVQFVLKMQYSGSATNAVEARQRSELGALQNSARFTIERESTRSDLQQALQSIEKKLPEASRKRGRKEADQFIGARYGLEDNGAGGFRLVDLAAAQNGVDPTQSRKRGA